MKFAAIDFETANRSPNSACAIGVVRVEDNQIVRRTHSLICPPDNYFEFTYVHGLTWRDVCKSPTFGQFWASIAETIAGVDFLVAHNARFDRNVLLSCCDAHQISINQIDWLCTVKVARKTWGISPTKLSDVCTRLSIDLNHHEALSDAEACANILIQAQGLLGEKIDYKSFL